MCYEMKGVNHLIGEEEFDYYLTLAKILDEGYPSIPHVHSSNASSPRPPTHDIPEKHDPTPEECATKYAPLWVEKIRNERVHE